MSAGSAARTWCRSRRSNSLAELNDALAAACITDLRRTIRGRRETVGEALGQRARPAARRCRPSRSTRASTRRRGWTASRWRPSGRTSTRCRSGSPGCGSRPGSARARSSFITTVARSPGTSGCTAGSAPRRSWITTSSCSQLKPGALARSLALAPGARARRLAGLLRRAVARDPGTRRRFRGRQADGRRAAALPRAARRAGRARRPRRIGGRRARRPRGAGPRPPRRTRTSPAR